MNTFLTIQFCTFILEKEIEEGLVLKSPLEARLGMRLPGQRLGGNEVRLEDARLYLPSFFPFA